ncbi:unnamed protein product [Caenorhabditis angaria]|uniref:BTB domain-containing protein n=1 Tax=Caenorhabditis angaria TaxID=860376 RepID=A0A9P1I890_9PELO|nr:unnamed protein product [Caenorhabditis angaria]
MTNRVVTNNYKTETTFNAYLWNGNLEEIEEIKVEGLKWKIGIKKTKIGRNWYLTFCISFPKTEKESMDNKMYNVQFMVVDQSGNNKNLMSNLNFSNQDIIENDVKEVTFTTKLWDTIYNESYYDQYRGTVYRYRKGSDDISIKTEVSVTSHTSFNNIPDTSHNFFNNIPGVTDIVLKVENTEFYMNKRDLCMNSEYFYELFVVQKCEDKVIEIQDVSVDDFTMFLIVLDHKNMFGSANILSSLRSGAFEKSLVLADRFKANIIHAKIALTMNVMFEIQPKSTTVFDYSTIRLKCLKFADKYNYTNILEHCLKSFGSAKEIKDASKSEDFTALSAETKARVLYRVLDFV